MLAITPPAHAVDELCAKRIDRSIASPGPHRPTQRVGLAGRKTSRDHCQSHRLFLKERHPEGFFQNLADLLARILDRCFFVTSLQVGVYQISLDRTGPHDRHLNHQIVKTAGPESGQHAHLGPALDLENSHRLGLADHVVDPGIFGGNIGQGQVPRPVPLDERKAFSDCRKHAE